MKRFALGLLLLLLSSLPTTAACNAVLPFILQPGTLADATQVMANFNAIITGLNNTCAASGINNDITALNAVAVLKPQNNLSDVINKQTSVNNLGLGCSASSPFSNTTKGAVNGVFATCFGVVADCVTDDTAAWNTAVTYANANFQTRIIAPYGCSTITALNAFTNGGMIVCITGIGTCTLSGSGNPVLTWNAGQGGGLMGMKLNNTGTNTNNFIFIHGNAFDNMFQDLILTSLIGQFLQMGAAVTNDQGGTTYISRIRSPSGLAQCGCPFINLINGYGLMIDDINVHINTANNPGRNFINANIVGPIATGLGFWDTINVKNSVIGPFYEEMHAALTAGGAVEDSNWVNNYIANCYLGCFNVSGTGLYTLSNISNNWIDANATGFCVSIAPSILEWMIFSANRVNTCATSGAVFGSGGWATHLQIIGNVFPTINLNNTSPTYAILISGDALGGNMNNNEVIGNSNSTIGLGGNLPQFGVSIGSATGGNNVLQGTRVIGNAMNGSGAPYALPSGVTFGLGNIASMNSLEVSSTTSLTPAASPWTFTNNTMQELDIWLSATTSLSLSINGCCFVGASGANGAQYVRMQPGNSFTATYTGVLTAIQEIH